MFILRSKSYATDELDNWEVVVLSRNQISKLSAILAISNCLPIPRIWYSEISLLMVLKPYMFSILMQQSHATSNVLCSFRKTFYFPQRLSFWQIQILKSLWSQNPVWKTRYLALGWDGFYWIIIYTILLLVSQVRSSTLHPLMFQARLHHSILYAPSQT
jgi:hypothetical protein